MNAEATPSKGLKITVLILRTLMGLLLLFGSITYLFHLITPPPMPPGDLKTFNEGLMASHYLMPTVKVIELLCGLAFVTGRFVPLAAVLISPIIVNIVGVHICLDHTGLPIAIFLVITNGLVAYYHRDRYAALFQAK